MKWHVDCLERDKVSDEHQPNQGPPGEGTRAGRAAFGPACSFLHCMGTEAEVQKRALSPGSQPRRNWESGCHIQKAEEG